MKKHIIMKKKNIERELNVELPADIIGMEIAPEGGAVVSRHASKKKCYCCGSTILNEKNGVHFCSKCGERHESRIRLPNDRKRENW